MFRRETYDNEGNVTELIERPFTPEEETARWRVEMAATDDDMSQEMMWHIIDEHNSLTGNSISQAKFDAKKAIHDTKPE